MSSTRPSRSRCHRLNCVTATLRHDHKKLLGLVLQLRRARRCTGCSNSAPIVGRLRLLWLVSTARGRTSRAGGWAPPRAGVRVSTARVGCRRWSHVRRAWHVSSRMRFNVSAVAMRHRVQGTKEAFQWRYARPRLVVALLARALDGPFQQHGHRRSRRSSASGPRHRCRSTVCNPSRRRRRRGLLQSKPGEFQHGALIRVTFQQHAAPDARARLSTAVNMHGRAARSRPGRRVSTRARRADTVAAGATGSRCQATS